MYHNMAQDGQKLSAVVIYRSYLQKLLAQKIFGTEVIVSEAIEHSCLEANVAQLTGVMVQLSGSYCGATVWWYYWCIEYSCLEANVGQRSGDVTGILGQLHGSIV